jgi:sporulation protein YlmC with PRC-barrel domain
MPDPVAWIMIEKGWTVVDSTGEQVGTVHEVLGDVEEDIFSGLLVLTGMLATKDVPSEVVGEIVEGRIQLLTTKDEVDALPAG